MNARTPSRTVSVLPQKQGGYSRIRLGIPCGDVTADAVLALNRLVKKYGCREYRSTIRQDLEIPFVRDEHAEALLEALERLGFRSRNAVVRPNVVACPGANPCPVAHVPTKELCMDIERFLDKAEAKGMLPPAFHVALSGCPNECSQAGINDVGFVGSAGAYGGERSQGFELLIGGSTHGSGRLAERIAFLGTEDVIPTFRDILHVYNEKAVDRPSFSNFILELGAEEFSRLLLERLRRRMWFFQI